MMKHDNTPLTPREERLLSRADRWERTASNKTEVNKRLYGILVTVSETAREPISDAEKILRIQQLTKGFNRV